MNYMNLDLETFSDVDLKKSGVYKYAESPNFEILLFGYAVDGGEVQVIDITRGEEVPQEIIKALIDDSVIKYSFNCSFERICISVWLCRNYPQYFNRYGINRDMGEKYLEPTAWHCTMVWSAYLGLPLSLVGVGAVLGLDKQKMEEGKNLIRYFCIPCAPTKANGGRTRNLPIHDEGKWEMFKSYNKRDVETEMAIQAKLSRFPVPNFIWDEYHLDQEINDRGIGIDLKFVNSAIEIDKEVKNSLMEKMQKLTGLENPNSVLQMREWLSEHGLDTDSLGKKDVAELIKTAPEGLIDVLKLRQQIARSSVKKYQAMSNVVCHDNRAHGMFQFYGANRTGRFSGRLIQLQNLPQNHIIDLAEARKLVREGNLDALGLLYDDIPDILSQLIRTAFIPQEERKFIVSDFSAIEARVIAWLAGEKWRMDIFEEGGDIYCASATKMFKVTVVKHGINGHLRQKGKIAELALGYGGSVGALKAMGALDMGLKEEELKSLVNSWRLANPRIVQLWWDVDKAVKECVKERKQADTHGIRFNYESGFLFITLPSGRRLAYVKPRMGENRFGGESITYEGIGTTKKWDRLESYGPKFVENITQAVARDILVYAMGTLRNCRIVGHVHDELIIEADKNMSLAAVCEQMGRTPPWAKGLILRADGYECKFYKKE
jgi:DNA polymerase